MYRATITTPVSLSTTSDNIADIDGWLQSVGAKRSPTKSPRGDYDIVDAETHSVGVIGLVYPLGDTNASRR